MLPRHFENIITYLRHPITNATTEGLNSKIQAIKANARGFRSFLNYRTRILFSAESSIFTHSKSPKKLKIGHGGPNLAFNISELALRHQQLLGKAGS